MSKFEKATSKTKNFFIKLFIGMINTVAVLELCMDESTGGLGLSGIFAFLVWLAVMFLLIKVNPYLSLVVSVGLYLILRVMSTGTIESIQGYIYLFLFAAIAFGILAYVRHRINIGNAVGEDWRTGDACPGCANRGKIIQHPGRTNTHTVHRGEEGYYGGTSFFGFFHTGKWYDAGDIVTEEYPPYFECTKCGRKWTQKEKKMN